MIWSVDLRRRFQRSPDGIELHMKFRSDHRRLVLFGPSGAGKSLALKMIVGLMTPSAGHGLLNDDVLFARARGVNLSPQRRGLGYVFQHYALFPHLTMTQNIAFGLHR